MTQPEVAVIGTQDEGTLAELRSLARLLDEVGQAAVATDCRGCIQYLNPAGETLFGWREPEAIGRPLLEVMRSPLSREQAAEIIPRLEAGQAWTGEFVIHRPGCDPCPTLLSAAPVRDARGTPIGMIALAIDIAERHRALDEARRIGEALRASEERFRALIEHSADSIALVGADTRIIYSSPGSERITGYTRAELTGSVGMNVVEETDLPVVGAFLEDLARHPGESRQVDVRIRRKDGTTRALVVIGTNLLDEPAVRGIVINSRDVTEQKELEERLRQAQKMEAIGRLAGGVAHDFNNILTVITATSGLLLEMLRPGDPMREDVLEIQKAANRGAGLTHQLLAVSRRQMLRLKTVDLNAAVQDMLAMLRRVIGEDVELVTELAPEVGCVRADAGQLAQVVLNLAVNARDAMPEGGRLTITTGALDLEEGEARRRAVLPAGRWVALTVADTGIGMSAEVQSHLFEPFFTTKPSGTGTGLGLSTVYGIVEQSGGQIEVSSAPGQGSAFTIFLPRVAAEPAAAAPDVPGPDAGRETILLVEDEAQVRVLARRVLERKGYVVIEASDGGDALALCERSPVPIDLLVTDVVMPGVSGRAVAECLRRDRPGLRVLYMTGYTDDEIVRRGLKDDGVALIQKPFSPDDLTRRVRALLDH